MKKLPKILVISITLILILTGCVSIDKEAKATPTPTPEVTTQSKTCTLTTKETNLKQEFTFDAINEKIKRAKLKMTYDNATLGVDSFSTFTEEQKEQYKNNMLNNLGLEENSIEGLDINFEFNDQLSVIVEANLNKVDPEILKQVGLYFDNTEFDLDKIIKDMQKAGAICS